MLALWQTEVKINKGNEPAVVLSHLLQGLRRSSVASSRFLILRIVALFLVSQRLAEAASRLMYSHC